MRQLFSHPKLRLVGVNVKGDITWLAKLEGSEDLIGDPAVIKAKCLDLASYEQRLSHVAGGAQRGYYSLDSICRRHLGRKLLKNESLRQSKWSRPSLREDQIVYAAKDAWAGSLVMQVLNKLAHTHRKPTSQELSAGTPVRLSARTSNKIIGYGRIVEKVSDDSGSTDGCNAGGDAGGRSKRRKTAEAFVVEVAHVTVRGALRPDGQQVMDDVSVGDNVQWALCSLRLSTDEELAEIKRRRDLADEARRSDASAANDAADANAGGNGAGNNDTPDRGDGTADNGPADAGNTLQGHMPEGATLDDYPPSHVPDPHGDDGPASLGGDNDNGNDDDQYV